MDVRHVRIESGEAVDLKKQVLTSEMNLLEIVRSIRNYRSLRKKEMKLKSELRVGLASLKSTLNTVAGLMPEYVKENHEKKISSHIGVRESRDIHKELDEIKRKLEQLG
ncbi:MAG: hypothetical protein RL557_71 [archaeon]|jgi:hypothetical protein